MIKITKLSIAGSQQIDLVFSDGASARWDASSILARDTFMTRPLADPAYFARAFVEAGALAWPNGLEFSGHALHAKLSETDHLVRLAA